jgi:SAM-dependent methyltransferase
VGEREEPGTSRRVGEREEPGTSRPGEQAPGRAEPAGNLAGHPDQDRWNARYGGDFRPSFAPHPLAERALSLPPPEGPVADLGCGPSGSALLAAAAGRQVTAVDVSDVALGMLAGEAGRRGLTGLISLVHADLAAWHPAPDGYALVLCTGYWDRDVFAAAAAAVAAGGVLAWEAFTGDARRVRPRLPAAWCLRPGEPAALLPSGFGVLDQHDLPDDERGTKRRLLARASPR